MPGDPPSSTAIKGRYSLVAPVAADGQFPYILVDSSGAIVVSPTPSPSSNNYDSAGLATNIVVKAAAGTLKTLAGVNNAGATRYIHIFDLAALPANGTAPNWAPIPVPANQAFAEVWDEGFIAANGIVIASSTTLATLTLTGVADVWFSGEFL